MWVQRIRQYVYSTATTVFLSVSLSILRQYSKVQLWIYNYIQSSYEKSQKIKKIMDYFYEWHYFIMNSIFHRRIEPLYNPWCSVCYMKCGKLTETYMNLLKQAPPSNDGILLRIQKMFPWNRLFVPAVSLFPFHQIHYPKHLTHPTQLLASTTQTNNINIIETMMNIYSTCNFIKVSYFDTCYDYLVIWKIKDKYISRVGVYNGNKHLKDDNISFEKAARSILTVEYTHPEMSNPIILTIDSGYFVENNEILSPTFVHRCLLMQSEPFVFDYKYKLKIMDNKIKTIHLDSNFFILIKKTGYELICL